MKLLFNAAAASAAAALLLAGCTNQSSASGTSGPSTSLHASFVVGAPVQTGGAPVGLVADGDAGVIVYNADRTVVRVDGSGNVTQLAEEVYGPVDPVLAFGSLWVVLHYSPAVDIARLDPSTGKIQAQVQIEYPIPRVSLVATDTDVWVAGGLNSPVAGSVWRIDPETNKVSDPIKVTDSDISAAAYDGGYVWFVGMLEVTPGMGMTWEGGQSSHVRLARMDATSGELTQYPGVVPNELWLVADAAEATWGLESGWGVWVGGANGSWTTPQGVLVAFDGFGNAVQSVKLGRAIGDLLATPDGLWVSDSLDATVTLLDPETGSTVAGPLTIGTPFPESGDGQAGESPITPGPMTAAGSTVWVALRGADSIVPISPVG